MKTNDAGNPVIEIAGQTIVCDKIRVVNPHIIVDPATKRCLCGVYEVTDGPRSGQGSRTITCADVLKAIDDAKTSRGHLCSPFVIDTAIKPLVQDRN